MLNPEPIGVALALHDPVRVLERGIERLLRRHERRAHAAPFQRPRGTIVAARPKAAARHADPDRPLVARVDEHRMDAGVVGAAPEPTFAPRVIPERLDDLPRVAAVLRAEEGAGNRSAPQIARAGRRFEGPHAFVVPRHRRAPRRVDVFDALGLRRVFGHWAVFPARAAVAGAFHLHAEVAHVLSDEQRAVRRAERHRDGIAK
jgi:hypothetical protein